MRTSSRTTPSPVGPLTAFARDRRLTAISFGARPSAGPPSAELDAAAAQLDEYFAGERERFDLPLAMPANDFQRAVCAALAEIPYGETVSYGEITAAIGHTREDVRKVAAAIGRNPFAIVIPCHRVIGADGSLTGYGGGLDSKARLLDLEAGQLQLELT
ncbi:MAG: cysteine methyltransferase [Solirubrobacterales bacterium]|nr:cysteine methyltransferase [Solirubrobacterales bacterium]